MGCKFFSNPHFSDSVKVHVSFFLSQLSKMEYVCRVNTDRVT